MPSRRLRSIELGRVYGVALALLAAILKPPLAAAAGYTLVGWNNLGMHCMDGDYSVFSLLPPYNTIHAQLIDPQGRLVRDPTGITVSYEAIGDPDASVNSTSQGKTNFWEHVQSLFGQALPVDHGLMGNNMPGASNQAQPMAFDTSAAWFIAEGIPITPYDDAHNKNPFPLMRLVARDQGGAVLATTDIVLPVSDEMDCKSCHASGSSAAAEPAEGWVDDPDPQRDMRLNILRLHDERQASDPAFANALSAAGYNASGLFATATTDGTSILCARCHLSEALSGSGLPGIEPLTQAVHRRMAGVVDPTTGMILGAVDNRSGCYRCHPGSVTRCLRGAMGAAVAADGSLAMQCQSCHGSMLDVASPDRTGWLNEPACQSCHTGTAITNNGQIRYTSAFEAPGQARVAVDETFATNPDTPAAGYSLYRFSTGHFGLKCEACHGSTHAEFPSTHRNDNLQSVALQGHVGALAECDTCHGSQPVTVSGGPHGMHPVGQAWVSRHSDALEAAGTAQCRNCHGADYRGTVLSRAQADRVIVTEELGTKQFWRGFQVGCYTCHLGPGNGDRNSNRPAVVSDTVVSTLANNTVSIQLAATDADGNPLTLRIVTQPSHGTAGLNGTTARYFPDAGFSGEDTFTFAAWDGSTDSNLGTVTVTVAPAIGCVGDCNGDGVVAIDELITGASLVLSNLPRSACPAFDFNGDGTVTVDELSAGINAAMNECAGAPPPTATATPTATPTPTQTGGVPTATPTTNPNATLANIQANIFTPTCAILGCHAAASHQGSLVLDAGVSYDQLVGPSGTGVPAANSAANAAGLLRVKPGDPDNSFLVIKLMGPPPDSLEGARMPFGGNPLPAEQIQAIRDWITAGALQN